MEVFLNDAIEWIFTLSPLSIYSIFFLVSYFENIVPPIPGDLLLVFGGYLAAERIVGFGNLLVLTTASSVMGFMTMYWIGSYWGYRIDEKREDFWLMKIIDIKYFERGKRWMQMWGQWVILANRFLTGTRSVIAITSGIYRTRIKTTILSSTASSLLWNSILLSLGWFVYENWKVLGTYLNIYGRVILAGIVLFIIVRLIFYLKRKGKNNQEL
ncbi:MAG: DedA family protein [Balneolaceae bacterium]